MYAARTTSEYEPNYNSVVELAEALKWFIEEGHRINLNRIYDAIVENTAVWFHVGSTELGRPITVAQYHCNYLTNHPLFTVFVETANTDPKLWMWMFSQTFGR
jgi:hypothetical protein